ncbi:MULTISPECIES: bifunctional [glutamine synthetase] adenylyltransferase/[glutamine synthetase]-adenylyl-L-tyrosine phosphorylase [unclassified Mesorhizobium]|uniref:bifunctional [glutamine synthetase] adenylyltransferase/[glutamine synthetase]-adenylyl-L-tyrosine phosphorylase n=1 Tax=unclassified Mesorhizobium TaxID=325217 RepID=UPI001128E7EA|nr:MULTISPECIES: bifunctional [glutamine synthetase] adenylyltransferase/[glutamine synthetase]-adenylyl-L-tyrosine phosphorylase [unclassified Mesorhizobium]TPK60343.1 bifunctional [glutamine synthetase] adenylyltransferase/[glutamine synthetase]-adenylyl-L-tyrosine phosphorylase [Mesorhizobium sp. B2-5-1]TPM65246.1 bifunctional [glutamine synthetase] adenylyltransferase/[glutamine synthetase]-adenylyl-L-tyrosine phosphorylase [Mesorhizobium sp. B2-1-9]TPM84061.1 bifunctional [glutamine synthet
MTAAAKRTAKDWLLKPAARLAPLDDSRARQELAEIATLAREEGLTRLAKFLAGTGEAQDFLAAVFDLSPFLRDMARRRPQILDGLFDQPIEARLKAIIVAIDRASFSETISESRLMMELRQWKADAHFLIALADLAAEAETSLTVRRLSDLADACTRAAVDFLLRDAHGQGKLKLPDPANPSNRSGWILLGMGKLGAHELNFSSDIDLVVFFDPEASAVVDPLDATELFSRLTRRLVRILQDRTEHGYVFRTDLRLRPDPGSTPLAIPVEAALRYYEARGQNWERAAMIKARPVAGDLDAGTAFLKELQPYIWRKYMDYAAIADVHSIKRQIHAHKGHGEIAVKGHNVKLGRGGIREIEFFVQTQQLIAGGRFPELRGRETVPMLGQLAARGWITAEARDALARQYWFLRRVEHAIQMVADEQTHTLPEDDEGLERIARMLGFADAAAFSLGFRASLQQVERHYAALFETAPELSAGIGNLVFTGDVDDPDTLQTLHGLGFQRTSDICRVIRGWHFGRYRVTQSAEARERLTELTPALLKAFGQTRRADEALIRFDEFLAGLPAGIQLFSLLQSNPALLKLMATIMGAAPRLAAIITRRPHVFDGLLDPALLTELPDRGYLSARLTAFLEGDRAYEDVLDRLRIFASEQKFLIGVRLLAGSIDPARAGRAFSDLADLTIEAALRAVMAEFEARHGTIAGGVVSLLGMGKLGSRELTAGSDVDLILLYDHDADAEESDGEKPLAPSHYYTRMTQRLISAVSAPTAEGVLYELDLRLRPSGNKGPVATHVDAFKKYQRQEAWTWEHMALSRARAIAGDARLCAEVEADVAAVLGQLRDAAKVKAEASDMRAMIEKEKPPRDLWDIKLIAGGLIDLEFIAQVAVVTGNVESGRRVTATAEVLSRLAPQFAAADVREELGEAYRLYLALTQMIRLCLTGQFERDDVPPGLSDLLLAVTDLPDFGVLEAHLKETSRKVRKDFNLLLRAGRP